MTNFWSKLPKPFTVLAPMESVTDMAFREMVAVNLPRPDVFFTEFVNADAIVHGVRDKLKYSENQRPIVAQIWGVNPTSLERAAKIIEDLSFDGIDINMGCPATDVVRAGGGAAMIKNPEKAIQVIQAVRNTVKIPVSVKTRLGWDFEIFRNCGISALTIHARTPQQMSKGIANWEEIKKIVKMDLKMVIIGNGDVESCNEVLEKYNKYDVDGVMIGRGIFSDPLVFDKSPHSLIKEQRIKLLEKHIELIKLYGGILGKFTKMYLNGFPGAKAMRLLYN